MTITEVGIVKEVREVQVEKGKSPMTITEVGMVKEVRKVQVEKEKSPMTITELGMVKEVRGWSPCRNERCFIRYYTGQNGLVILHKGSCKWA